MTALILQARLDSSRLPEKALLPLGGRPLILRVMQALTFIPCDARILACPEDSVSAFAPLAKEADFSIVAGPKDDVLERFCIAIKSCAAENVIRATGDNPFVFADAAAALEREAKELNSDYAGFSNLPVGAGVEIVSSKALLKAAEDSVLPYEREHVCPYLYNNPQFFALHRPLAPLKWQESKLRITIDTPEDYKQAQALYGILSELPLEKRFSGEAIIAASKRLFISGS